MLRRSSIAWIQMTNTVIRWALSTDEHQLSIDEHWVYNKHWAPTSIKNSRASSFDEHCMTNKYRWSLTTKFQWASNTDEYRIPMNIEYRIPMGIEYRWILSTDEHWVHYLCAWVAVTFEYNGMLRELSTGRVHPRAWSGRVCSDRVLSGRAGLGGSH